MNIYEAIYEACKRTGFKVGISRDYHSFSVDFFRDNNKSTMIQYDTYFGWRFLRYNQEEIVSDRITEAEAIEILTNSFAEFGTELERAA